MKKEKADNCIEKKYNKVKSFEKITTWFIGFRLDWGGERARLQKVGHGGGNMLSTY